MIQIERYVRGSEINGAVKWQAPGQRREREWANNIFLIKSTSTWSLVFPRPLPPLTAWAYRTQVLFHARPNYLHGLYPQCLVSFVLGSHYPLRSFSLQYSSGSPRSAQVSGCFSISTIILTSPDFLRRSYSTAYLVWF